MKTANSNNHNKDGENVLYGDGHVEFQSNPFVGTQKDNIYTAHATGVPTQSNPVATGLYVSPTDQNDSVLLPTDD